MRNFSKKVKSDMARPITEKVLDGVTATGESAAFDTMGHTHIGMSVTASSVSTGGTAKLQGSDDGTNWHELASQTISGNGTTNSQVIGAHRFVRSNLTARTDGTYTSYISLSGFAGVK
jgi:hypothetical protein